MKRYCIVCENIFGCVKGGIKYDCVDCICMGSCKFRNVGTMSYVKNTQVTGGICEGCWERRQAIKLAVKTHQIPHRLKVTLP